MWKIPLFDIGFDNREIEAVQQVLSSGWLTMGEVTEQFEQRFSEYMNVKHAIAVSNCTAALHLANLALGIGEGDEVICPSLSFVAGANSIVYAGAEPVFAGVTSLRDFNISPDDVEVKITKKTKAIQILHFGGNPCNMSDIIELAGKYGLSVIEDCAHSPGAEYNGKKCGTIGDIGCFSFYSNKNLAVGEGGMVTTNRDDLAKKIRLMRTHGMTTLALDRHLGRTFSYDVVELGYNYRIDEIRSAIGKVQLEKLERNNVRRKELVKIYKEKLTDIQGLTIPFKDNSGLSSCHIFPVLLDNGINRSEFMGYLKGKGIQSSIHYPAIHLFDFYRHNYGHKDGLLPVTEDIARREMTLPLYPSMQKEDVHYVCDLIVEYIEREEVLR